jgi:hypothetical protein
MKTHLCHGFSLLLFIAVITACGGSGSIGGNTEVPVVSVTLKNGSLNLNWNDVNAHQYRVFYWHGNETPQEHMTNSTTYALPSLTSGTYTIIVEAYDELGNSLFSAPITAVVPYV